MAEERQTEMRPSPALDTAAKVIRVATVPPLMVAALLLILRARLGADFADMTDLGIGWAGLVLLPLLAYPLQMIHPDLRRSGREEQRKLAFLLNLVGYVGCFIYSLLSGTRPIRRLLTVYFLTVLFLTILNKWAGVRASGHAASAVSPCVFCAVYSVAGAAVAFGVVCALSVWASLRLERHKPRDIAAGVGAFVLALAVTLLIYP